METTSSGPARAEKRERAFTPRGMRLADAVFYTGFGQTKFLQLVGDERLPKGVMVDGCRLWDRLQLDAALDVLMDAGGTSPDAGASGWEDVLK